MSDTSLRILFIIDEMEALTAGGTERQILQMIAMVKKEGAQPVLCLLRGTEWVDAELAGIEVVRFDLRSLFAVRGFGQMRDLYRWLVRERFDIIHSFFVEANIIAPILGWMARVPVRIGSRRNLNHWMTFPYKVLQSVSNLFVTRLAANCDAVRRRVEETEFFSKGKIDVIYNGLDTDHFRPNANERRQKRTTLAIGDQEVVVGNTSTLRPPKGVDDFIRATAIVDKEFPIRILIVGDGPLRTEFQKLAEELGIAERTIFAGAQTDVRPWLAAMDIAVLSSHSEGFSNSILEYMASGLPCVASDVGGNAEAMSGCGKVVPVGDVEGLARAVLELAQSRSLREQLGTCLRCRSALFSLPSARKRLIGYYRKLHGSP